MGIGMGFGKSALGIGLVLLVGLSGCASEVVSSTTKISTQTVKLGDLQIGLYADGRVSVPYMEADFEVSGTVEAILVTVGQFVKAGDLLAELDDTDLVAAAAQSRRDLDKAQAAYDDAVVSRTYALATERIRLNSLYAKTQAVFDDEDFQKAISDAEIRVDERTAEQVDAQAAYDLALETGSPTDIAAALKSLESADDAMDLAASALVNAQENLEDALVKFASDASTASENYQLEKLKYDNLVDSTLSVTNAEYNLTSALEKSAMAEENVALAKLYAPTSGKVIDLPYAVGSYVIARSPSESSTTTVHFATLTDPGVVYLTASITEGDVSGLEVGQSFKATVDALSLANVAGQVSSISSIPKIDNTGIVTFSVTSLVAAPDERLLNGMSVFITYLKKEKLDVLLVSNKAIFLEDGQQYVMVQKTDGSYEKRAVTAGLTNGTISEIVEGLVAGDIVATSGVNP
jgi:multidrug efflux pump subunit AcrA (membrane-fusion protein)